MIEQIRRVGWLTVEIALLLVIVCVLLNIILGADSGSFIGSVAANAAQFLQSIPPGTFLGVVLVVILYWLVRSRIAGRS
jgi:hypothetical protein